MIELNSGKLAPATSVSGGSSSSYSFGCDSCQHVDEFTIRRPSNSEYDLTYTTTDLDISVPFSIRFVTISAQSRCKFAIDFVDTVGNKTIMTQEAHN